ncbi:MAG: alkaline phosphatase family protein [bacterium]
MSKKCILVGMDGVSPNFVLRLIEQGNLPNFRRMMDEGTFAPHCLSSLPTSTPENWTTIATGAWNGTHQVMSFQTFQPPELHGHWMAGYTSRESEAEFIWDAVERAGKQSILLKYPASHPPTMKTGVQVCGCHVRPCAHQIDGAHLFSTVEPRNAPLILRESSGGMKLPDSGRPVLVGEMTFSARGMGGESVGVGLDERTALYGVPDSEVAKPRGIGLNTPVCKLLPPGKTFYLFVISTGEGAYDKIAIARDQSCQQKLAELAQGEWSPWILERFQTVDGTREGTLRFKLEELSGDGKVVKVYATQIMDVDHYTFPESVGRELYEKVGPFITDIGWEGLGHYGSKPWFNESVMLDLADYQHEWFANAVQYLTRTRDWALCMLQAHCIDCANHHCLPLADPGVNPDRRSRERYLGFIEKLYESLDRMLGRIMDLADDDTAIFVVSDHGGLSGHIRIDVQNVLEGAGLLVRKADGEIDWTNTRAYVQNSIFVNVNLRGREPQGTVPPEKYDKTCDEIIASLHAYVEPTTSLHPFNLVLRKVDMRYVGLYGDPTAKKIGDVLFTLREPFGGTHGEQLSTAQWGIGSNTSLLIMRGSGIRRGVRLDRTVWLTDIVPTICRLIEVPVPRQTEGAILYQALE